MPILVLCSAGRPWPLADGSESSAGRIIHHPREEEKGQIDCDHFVTAQRQATVGFSVAYRVKHPGTKQRMFATEQQWIAHASFTLIDFARPNTQPAKTY
jgi:hypothetical protein